LLRRKLRKKGKSKRKKGRKKKPLEGHKRRSGKNWKL
jgi:hypothetical protein